MNGTGIKGGAYGFRVSSINKLVDTKSANNTTLLHFLERTVVNHFPEMEEFLEELAKPSDAYRVSLLDTKKGTNEIRDGLRTLRNELQENFAELDNSSNPNDLFGKKMWRFVGEAKERLDDLIDEVTLADTTFVEVVRYYGEDEKNMTSTEFFGIFKTFVTSYQVGLSPRFQIVILIQVLRNARWRTKLSPKNELRLSGEDNKLKRTEQHVPNRRKTLRQKRIRLCSIPFSRNYEQATASKVVPGNAPPQKNVSLLVRPHLLSCRSCHPRSLSYQRMEIVMRVTWQEGCWLH
jgi:hypothetical protein